MPGKNKRLDYVNSILKSKNTVQITGSKSETNRLLILQKNYPNLTVENASDSDDSVHLAAALKSQEELIDIGHAGTAMRFLTAYYALTNGVEVELTGSERMQNRPIGILVEALSSLGLDISYTEKEGYPPLKIKGKIPTKNNLHIAGNVSSQYITALILMASKLEDGLSINLSSEITSRPYLEMTLSLVHKLGIKTSFEGQQIKVFPKTKIDDISITVESDWSSASYFYSLVSLCPIGSQIRLSSYRKKSLQGDRCLADIYEELGVQSEFKNGGVLLTKVGKPKSQILKLNLIDAPDIAQTIVVSCLGLGLGAELTGLHTLKIKETDRLVALKNEIEKLGGTIDITDHSLYLHAESSLKPDCSIATYKDHRMAMAFAPLSLMVPMIIEDADVVTKSYQGFWDDLDACFV